MIQLVKFFGSPKPGIYLKLFIRTNAHLENNIVGIMHMHESILISGGGVNSR